MFALSVFCSCFSENVSFSRNFSWFQGKKCRFHVVPLFWIYILDSKKCFKFNFFLSLSPWNIKMFAPNVHIRRTAILCTKSHELWWLLALLICSRLLFVPAAVVCFFKSGALILTWKVDCAVVHLGPRGPRIEPQLKRPLFFFCVFHIAVVPMEMSRPRLAAPCAKCQHFAATSGK